MNIRLGTAGTVIINSYNKLTLTIDINKLLVPTSPIYSSANPDSIISGKNPNVSVPTAIFQSFYDAPGGFIEELHEITYSFGLEYLYNKQLAIRGGYFHENETKGNRKYFTTGAGFRLKQFEIDFSYLMPLAQNHPLAQTIRFSLAFDLPGAGKISSNQK
jgi:long-subunit fatty acid transport protein